MKTKQYEPKRPRMANAGELYLFDDSCGRISAKSYHKHNDIRLPNNAGYDFCDKAFDALDRYTTSLKRRKEQLINK